ncbi:hypothetical protein JTB14_015553 [Gonioctena quinquepunctata]|nr:hypothetical protein JTB14_015553 [Gonioctena quinquepunctata]
MLPQESDRCGIEIGVSTHVIHASGSGLIHPPLANSSNNIVAEMIKYFSNYNSDMVALDLEEEDAGNRLCRTAENAEFGYIVLEKENLQTESYPHFYLIC